MEIEITYRLARSEDTDAINRFYGDSYGRVRDQKNFNWEFGQAPAGPSIYVVAEHAGKIIGTQCVIPYLLVTFDHRTILSGKSEDTLIAKQFRGKKVFESMYVLLLEECKKKGINIIWGFTYAKKPFVRLGFKIPFHAKMGILVQRPKAAYRYLIGRSAGNSTLTKLKIKGLCYFSKLKSITRRSKNNETLQLNHNFDALNSSKFNYLHSPDGFGLNLNKEFLEYRIQNNPYSNKYGSVSFKVKEEILFSMIYHINDENIGYLINIYLARELEKKRIRNCLATALFETELKNCSLLRVWGFNHCPQNSREMNMLDYFGFTYINKGISLVWLDLNPTPVLDPHSFVLSRMASQGTD